MAKEGTKEPKNKKTEQQSDEKTAKAETTPKEEDKKELAKKSASKKENQKDIDTKGPRSKRSKKYREVAALVEKDTYYNTEEGIKLVKKTSTTKFDASVEIHVRLGVDPSASDQQVRGTVNLPEGTGKKKRVAVVCGPDKEKEAKDAGAEKVGGEALIKEIEKGKLDFDVLVATPDMMAQVGKVGKILGTKGLMPNPKAGTVTPDVGKAVKGLKTGMVEFRVDKNGIVHQVIGKVSFDEKKLEANYNAFVDAIKHAKPSGAKGTYIHSITLTTTMGPGIKITL
ncbi:50S ribosomal protein L1 [candidate division WS5 bacterium]|uniref:Large ribosomal subunit protein uL1 n=1 Tax=candidate division WS5 bacterium TaxID=2093353 RepID=A0A419DA79_9BACT|nr:MAG: 50S ribosomal protein L1 [candidate division WS5 bacterium]